VAIGGGTTMLLHCDFVYASENTRLHLPFVDIALGPEFGSSYLLQLRAGYLRAAEALFLAQPFDATKAAQLGVVTAVVPDQQLLPTARETASKLAAKPAQALQACKRLMRDALHEPLVSTVKRENENFAARLGSSEAKEAFAKFLGKKSR
jgi:enoyl-CoA hydratase/carnithine racemase